MNAICKVKEVVTGLWSLVVGLKVTGKNYVLPQITVHYPRQTEGLLWEGFRGHPVLVPKPKDPTKPKCIACMLCVSSCPSGCIKVVKAKPPVVEEKPQPEAPEGMAGEVEKKTAPPKAKAPKEPSKWIVNYTTCSQCGTCAEVCPVKSIAYSTQVNQASFDRKDFEAIDCLALLRAQAAAKTPTPKSEPAETADAQA